MRRQLTALTSFPYAGKRLKAGDEFGASQTDATLLVAIKKARYATRVMTADVNYSTRATQQPSPGGLGAAIVQAAVDKLDGEMTGAVAAPARDTLRLPERAKRLGMPMKNGGGDAET